MMRAIHGSCVLTLFLAASSALSQGGAVSGLVLDSAGGPVRGAVIAQFWDSGGNEQHPQGYMLAHDASETGADGRFTRAVESGDRPIALLAIDATQQFGGMVIVDPKQRSGEPLTIRLAPLIEVRGMFSCRELGRAPGWTNVYVNLAPPHAIPVLQCDSDNASFAFKLPPGEYSFDGYGSGVFGVDQALTLTAGTSALDMGTIDLQATGIARHAGKEPPAWNVTDARGLSKAVSYADFKGKWVLIEFWGFW